MLLFKILFHFDHRGSYYRFPTVADSYNVASISTKFGTVMAEGSGPSWAVMVREEVSETVIGNRSKIVQ